MAAGNFYGVTPYEGRYDALLPVALSFDKQQGGFKVDDKLDVGGEVRSMQWINYEGEKMLVVGRNNDNLVFLKPILK